MTRGTAALTFAAVAAVLIAKNSIRATALSILAIIVVVLSTSLVSATDNNNNNNNDLYVAPNQNAGAWLGAHSSAFQTLGPFINQLLLKEVAGLSISPVSADSGHLTVDDINITGIKCNDCVSLSLQDGYAEVKLSSASVYAHFHAEYKHLIHLHTTCSPSIEGIDLIADAKFTTPTADGKPQVALTVKSLKFGKIHLGCSGIIGHIANALTDLVGHLTGKIMDRVVSKVVGKILNKKLASLQLKKSFDGLLVDFSLMPKQTAITQSAAIISVLGKISPAQHPTIQFPFPPPPVLKTSCAGGMVSIGISEWTLNTLGYSMYAMKMLQATIPSIISAGDLKFLMPGFEHVLGKNARLNLTLAAGGASPAFDSIPSTQSLAITMPLNISIVGGNHTKYELACKVNVGAGVGLGTNYSAPKLHLSLQSLALEEPKVAFSNVGGLGFAVPLIVNLLDGALSKTVVPLFNKIFAKHGLPLPTIDGFELDAGKVVYNDNSICIAAGLKVTN